MNKQLFFVFSILMLFSLATVVSAVPGIPHAFWGTVSVNGAVAADGSTIVAKINGIEVASTASKGGVYGQSPAAIFYITDDTNDKNGKTITFYVKGVKATTYSFSNGQVTELNLAVTVSGGGGGGSSGGGGGGSSGGSTGTVTTGMCIESWECGEWTPCENDHQFRACNDLNSCGTSENKPEEFRECITPPGTPITDEEIMTAQKGGLFGITGLTIGGVGTAALLGLIALAIILALLIIFYLMRRGKKKKKK